jgi:Phytochelatin synthase
MKRNIFRGSVVIIALLGATILALAPSRVPPEAIESSVSRAQQVLDRAWDLPVAATYKPRLVWQSNASLCGPASLANVLRSLGDTAVTESAVLANAGPCWFGICPLGLTLDQLAQVAQAHTNQKVTVLRDLSEEAFREHMRRTNDLSRRYIVNFSREKIFGAGVGHHSPIGGYLDDDDLVFVLDVNRNFRPWLIARTRLFSAVNTLDGERNRGLLLIE